MVVNEVKNTGLNLKIALLKAKDFVVEPGLFLLRRLKVSIKTILLLTTMPANATQLIPVCKVLNDLSSMRSEMNTPQKTRGWQTKRYLLDKNY